MMKVTRTLLVNGTERTVEAEPQARLLDVLREVLSLTGTKEGCGEGECGACSVLLGDDVVDSCLVLFGQLADGDRILTVEGLPPLTLPSPLRGEETQFPLPCGERVRVRGGTSGGEGQGEGAKLHPLQECFVTEGGTQCGICTPGMLIVAHALLAKNPKPTRAEIAAALSGNLCRCTGYGRIVDAVERAAQVMRGEA